MNWREFIDSPESCRYWILGPDGMYSRGNPKKVPYESRVDPTEKDERSDAYWKHYGYDFAPSLEDDYYR